MLNREKTFDGRSSAVSEIAPVLSVSGATKRFGKSAAVDGVDLDVRPGELVALLGPNGAGKTTLVSLITGQRKPDSGRVLVFGSDPRDPATRSAVGVTPQEIGFPDMLSVREIVHLVCSHYDTAKPVQDLISCFGLGDFSEKQAGGLSGGQKRRLATALAFAGNPELVVLDEPTTGLDVESRRELWAIIRRYVADGGSVLLTTHYLDEVEALASRVYLVASGKVIAHGTVDQIKSRVGLMRLKLPMTLERCEELHLETATRLEGAGDSVVIFTRSVEETIGEILVRGIVVNLDTVEIGRAGLEEAFLAIVGSSGYSERGEKN